ncbi:hypothetical protein PFLUV_G00238960 [Perca fluviatilis]|uniref:Uncharacterized protein n=1 Tax=Perca fluviatilis TaxID=8168 RepID=A0A6A5E4L2_PERFL|nr:hypothetical protein PFLUV_G00238960 [Perca fluviatilis]
MQCVNVVKKRRLEPGVEPWSCRKRVCLGAELQVTECPMETSHSFTASNQHPEQPDDVILNLAAERANQVLPFKIVVRLPADQSSSQMSTRP